MTGAERGSSRKPWLEHTRIPSWASNGRPSYPYRCMCDCVSQEAATFVFRSSYLPSYTRQPQDSGISDGQEVTGLWDELGRWGPIKAIASYFNLPRCLMMQLTTTPICTILPSGSYLQQYLCSWLESMTEFEASDPPKLSITSHHCPMVRPAPTTIILNRAEVTNVEPHV